MIKHSASAENVSWSSPSLSASPPPPPLPPQACSRWTRASPVSGETSCAHCRGRYASMHSRTTSLNSYSAGCKGDRTGPGHLAEDDDSAWPALCERELHSLHRNVPALRRRDVDTAAIRQHFYPEGGWGWIVCGAAFLAHLLTSGMQLAFGLLYLNVLKFLVSRRNVVDRDAYEMGTAWLGALSLSVSFLAAPAIVAVCRRKSTRLAAVLGGLLLPLSCLFTSFAVQFHQAVLSYGVLMGLGVGLVRETACLVLGHYFKKRREFVEMVAQAGTGVGIALFSVLYKEAIGKLKWRLGLQAVTGLLCLAFFLGMVYRSANLYHPQRRAICHLKNQRKKVKEKKSHLKTKKPPLFDFSPLRSRALRVLMVSCATAALGLYTPIFYLALQGYNEGIEDSSLVLLQTFMGFASALGCVSFGFVTVRPSSQCLISRQYLCQASMVGIGISLLALGTVQGYHGYVLFVWLYGLCLGGFMYSVKMFTLERIRAKNFTRAWSFVQGAQSLPVLLGIPITGYINQTHAKAGYYFSFLATLLGAFLMFLVGQPKKEQQQQQIDSINANNHLLLHRHEDECICPSSQQQQQQQQQMLMLGPICMNSSYPEVNPYSMYHQRQAALANYEPIFGSYHHIPSRRHSYRARGHYQRRPSATDNTSSHCLTKSMSYGANMEYTGCGLNGSVHCITKDADFLKYKHVTPLRPILRPSKSVPEGLASWDTYNSYRRLNHSHHHRHHPVRNVQVIEQITTSV